MELAWLEDFVALADARSFSRAATRRHVTQPAFSRRVRALEHWVGAVLFERTATGTRLTPAGEQFARGVPLLIRGLAQLRRETCALGERVAPIQFAATHALSYAFFPAWLRRMEGAGAAAALTLQSDSMQACEDLMLTGEAQLLLCHAHPLAPTRLGEPLFHMADVGHDRLAPFSAPDADGAPRWRLGAAEEIPLLAYDGSSGIGRIVAAQRFDQRAPTLVPVFRAQLAAVLLGMAREGRGVAWLPASLASDDVARGTLVASGDDSWCAPLTIALIRPAARQGAATERLWSAATAMAMAA